MKITAVLVIMMVAVLVDRCADAFVPCAPCSDGNCDPPEDCLHGISTDICGRKVCAKGPGQRCGGKFNIYGTCGDGMFCACNRCSGCSLATLECHEPKFSAKCV